MKMNNITMNYIRGLVDDKAKTKRTALSAALEKVQKERENFLGKFNKEIEKLEADTRKKAEAIGAKYNIPLVKDWSGNDCKIKVDINNFNESGNPYMKKEIETATTKLNEFVEAVAAKSNEIIAKLSLGGTVADLEKLLADIKF